MSTHALRTSDIPAGFRALRWLDIALLALTLPVFLLADFPMLGWLTGAVAWLGQRGIAALVERRAKAATDARTAVGLMAGSMIGRGWIVALAIFGVGLTDSDAGLAAAVLFLALFTIRFTAQAILRPFEASGARR